MAHTGLLSLILSMVMMKQGQVTEEQLWNLLKRLGIHPDRPHPQFGDVQRFISKDFVDQMYLDKERKTSGEYWFSWGPRAEAEVNKKELLAFVAELHSGDLAQWEGQFKDVLENAKPLRGIQD